jgi:hypothetical protein
LLAGYSSPTSYEQYYDQQQVKEMQISFLLPPIPEDSVLPDAPEMSGKTGVDENTEMIPSIIDGLSTLSNAMSECRLLGKACSKPPSVKVPESAQVRLKAS